MSGRVLAMPVNSRASRLTPRDGLTAAVLRACIRLGLSEKELAGLLGMNEAQWSRQKAGRDGHRLHVQRFDDLPPAEHGVFLDALIEELARLRGKSVVARSGHLVQVADALRATADAVEAIATQGQPALPFGKAVGE